MKRLISLFLGMLFALSSLGFASTRVFAQTADCEVSGDYGSFSVNETNKTVTGRFSIHGPQNCTPTQVSIAVWSCADDCSNLQAQKFEGGASGNFSYAGAAQTNQAFPTHTITTSLPNDKNRCNLQIDLVRGGQRADPSHPFPNGPFYDGRRMSTIVIKNPVCKEVETVTNTVTNTVEVPVEVIREVPVERVVTVDRPVVQTVQAAQTVKSLPNTGPGAVLAVPAITSVAAGVGHYLYNRRKY